MKFINFNMFAKFKSLLSKKNIDTFIIDKENFKFAGDVCFSRQENFNTFDLKDELLDIQKKKQEIFSIYWNVFKLKYKLTLVSALIKSSIFVLKPGKIGREFNKTLCYLTKYKGELKPALFEVLNGEGYFILENNRKIKLVKVVKVKTGSQVYVPKGFKFTLINSSENKNLICLSLLGKDTRFYSNICKLQKGASLFYTTQGFVRNKNVEPSYRLENFEGDYLIDEESRELFGQKDVFLDTLAFDKKKGLYMEFMSFPEKFNFLK